MEEDVSLDELDKQIIRELQLGLEATPNVTSIAKKLGKPTATVHSRLKRLEKKGIIQGYRPVIAAEKVGKGMTLFMQIKATSKGSPEELVESWSKIPEVKEVWYTDGDYMFLLKISVKSLEDFYALEKKIIHSSMYEWHVTAVLNTFKTETAHLIDF